MSYTCPRCGMTSHNPNDEREGYCGNCHDWTVAEVRAWAQQQAIDAAVAKFPPIPPEIADRIVELLLPTDVER